MGWKSGAAKGAAIGLSFGLGGAIVGAGVGALLGSSKKVIIVDDDGVYFDADKAEWSDVVKVEDIGEGCFRFRFRGGLCVEVRDDNIQWDEGYREYFTGEESDEEIDISFCDDFDITEIDCDNIQTKDFAQILQAIKSVLWANDLAETIEGTDGLSICYFEWLRYAVMGFDLIEKVSGLKGFGRSQKRKQIIAYQNEFATLIKERLSHIDPDDVDNHEIIADAFMSVDLEEKEGINVLSVAYDNYRNARAYGREVDADILAKILATECDDAKPLGSAEWSKRRKKIICTDEKASLSIWSEGVKIPETMVMGAQDIVAYNDIVPDDMKLKFEPNHPRNGITYIQHPMQQNVYIDVGTFHSSMLERKYGELMELLDALGATLITCEVEDNNTRDEKKRRKVAGDANIDVPVAVELSAQYEQSRSSSRMRTLYKKLQKRVVNRRLKPGEKPYIPDGLIFYPFEDTWKNLARNVLNGRRLEEETTLTYREDYAMTGQQLKSFGAKVKSVIPSYEFGAGANFSREFEKELKQLKSTVWHYHVCFGGEQSESATNTKQLPQEIEREQIEGTNDGDMFAGREKVFKMIRRLAKSGNVQQTGLFDDEQRAAIESFAQKKGIADDVDDLIEEALG